MSVDRSDNRIDNDSDNPPKDQSANSTTVGRTQEKSGVQNIVVVGGGPAGLTAAYYLARNAMLNNEQLIRIRLLEKRAQEGANLRTQTVVLNLARQMDLVDMIQPGEELTIDDIKFIESLTSSVQIKISKVQDFILRRIAYLNQQHEKKNAYSIANIKADWNTLETITHNNTQPLKPSMIQEKKINIMNVYSYFLDAQNKMGYALSGLSIRISENNKLSFLYTIALSQLKTLLALEKDITQDDIKKLLEDEENIRKITIAAFVLRTPNGMHFTKSKNNSLSYAFLTSAGTLKECTIADDNLKKILGNDYADIMLSNNFDSQKLIPYLSEIIKPILENESKINLIDLEYQSSIEQIDFNNGTINTVDKNKNLKTESFQHIIAADGAQAETLKKLPKEEAIRRTTPKNMEHIENSYHLGAYIELSRTDGKEIKLPTMEFTSHYLNDFLYFIRFMQSSRIDANKTTSKVQFIGEIPKNLHDDIKDLNNKIDEATRYIKIIEEMIADKFKAIENMITKIKKFQKNTTGTENAIISQLIDLSEKINRRQEKPENIKEQIQQIGKLINQLDSTFNQQTKNALSDGLYMLILNSGSHDLHSKKEELTTLQQTLLAEKNETITNYIRKCAAKYLNIEESKLQCKMHLADPKKPTADNKNKLRALAFQGKSEKAEIAAKSINEHHFYLLGDAYFTPNYPVGHGLNDGMEAAKEVGILSKLNDSFSKDLHLKNYNTLTEANANKAIEFMQWIRRASFLGVTRTILAKMLEYLVDKQAKDEKITFISSTNKQITQYIDDVFNPITSPIIDADQHKKLQSILKSPTLLKACKEYIASKIEKINSDVVKQVPMLLEIANKTYDYTKIIQDLKTIAGSANTLLAPSGVKAIIKILSSPSDISNKAVMNILATRQENKHHARDPNIQNFYNNILKKLNPPNMNTLYETLQSAIEDYEKALSAQWDNAAPKTNQHTLFSQQPNKSNDAHEKAPLLKNDDNNSAPKP